MHSNSGLPFLFLLFILVIACSSENNKAKKLVASTETVYQSDSLSTILSPVKIKNPSIPPTLDREKIKQYLNQKKEEGIPLVVHVFIPLCDNIHQGIVPTTESLGDGMSLRTNLYWSTSTGTKTFFKNHKNWKLIIEEKDIDTNVLERVTFERDYNGTKVYLIADAYRGDRMQETVNDFLAALAGQKTDSIELTNGESLKVGDAADLMIFNGHNGMMDPIIVKDWIKTDTIPKDAVISACNSYHYFSDELMGARAYPLARTNTLLHPGAYVLTQVIDDWVNNVEEKQLCLNAGRAYCQKHSCGAGTKVYKAGW